MSESDIRARRDHVAGQSAKARSTPSAQAHGLCSVTRKASGGELPREVPEPCHGRDRLAAWPPGRLAAPGIRLRRSTWSAKRRYSRWRMLPAGEAREALRPPTSDSESSLHRRRTRCSPRRGPRVPPHLTYCPKSPRSPSVARPVPETQPSRPPHRRCLVIASAWIPPCVPGDRFRHAARNRQRQEGEERSIPRCVGGAHHRSGLSPHALFADGGIYKPGNLLSIRHANPYLRTRT